MKFSDLTDGARDALASAGAFATDLVSPTLRLGVTGLARSGKTVFVVEDRCSHDDGELSEGVLHGAEIECPRHGARFDMSNGHATRMPAVAPIETFAARVEGDDVLVDVPEY